MSEILDRIPTAVQYRVSWAMQTITEWNMSLVTARNMERIAQSPGRYEWEMRYAKEYAAQRDSLARALEILADFRVRAGAQGINPDAVCAQLGSYVLPYPEGPHVRAFRPLPLKEVAHE